MTSETTTTWLTQAKSARSDTWVSLSRSGESATDADDVILAVHDGDDSALEGVELRVTNRGPNLGDMLWAQGQMFTAISQGVIDALTSIGATGWRSVPITGRYGNGDALTGYHVLVVLGQCGDFSVNAIGNRRKVGVDPTSEWDGSDVFWIRTRPAQFTFCVTDRVRQAFDAAGLTRIEYEHPDEF